MPRVTSCDTSVRRTLAQHACVTVAIRRQPGPVILDRPAWCPPRHRHGGRHVASSAAGVLRHRWGDPGGGGGGQRRSVDIFEIKLAFVAATRECSRPAQPAPSEASRPRFDVDGSGDIDGEELGAVAAELGMAMSAAEVRRRWRQHPPPSPWRRRRPLPLTA